MSSLVTQALPLRSGSVGHGSVQDQPAKGSPTPLFVTGRPTSEYGSNLSQASNGGAFRFSSGRTIGVTRELGRGGTTRVFETTDGSALRIANPGQSEEEMAENLKYLMDFAQTHQQLEGQGVAVPRLIEIGWGPKGRTVEYVLVEKIGVRYFADEWFKRLNRDPRLMARREAEALKAFARAAKNFADIQDFAFHQLAWSGTRWVLLDWLKEARLVVSHNDDTIFSRALRALDQTGSGAQKNAFAIVFIKQLEREILSARGAPLVCGDWLNSSESYDPEGSTRNRGSSRTPAMP